MARKSKSKEVQDNDPEVQAKQNEKKELTIILMFEELKRQNKSLQVKINFLTGEMYKLTREYAKTKAMVLERLSKQNSYLNTLEKSNANVEETLINVLLAIRQNEYLQAWYPAQKGYDEMNVSGRHPVSLERDNKN